LIKTMVKWSLFIYLAGWVLSYFIFFPAFAQIIAILLFNAVYIVYKIFRLIIKMFTAITSNNN